MSLSIVVDAGVLGLVTQRRGVDAADACRRWMTECLRRGHSFFVPEIADYEVRRELLRAGKATGLARLDAFSSAEPDRYIPLTTAVMRRAAELWADARRSGRPTAPDHALDCDVILAAQALSLAHGSNDVVVATPNVGHLARFVTAKEWTNIQP